MWDCRFMDVKPGFLFNYKGAMCRKTTSGYRFVHNTDAVLNKQGPYTVFALADHEPVKLYTVQVPGFEGEYVVRMYPYTD